MTTNTDCPCGSAKPSASCCEPIISGKIPAPTAEALMRARYTSYATGRIDFIEKTHAPESRADFDRTASEKWAKDSKWHGLSIAATKDGGPDDATGVVSFVARFSTGDDHYEHREIASFRKDGATWFFVDGKSPKPDTYQKTGPDVGRNDPCHCGSGKKFKKCHGKA
ncbi:MAG: YchJ family protein [Elusimicrobia bacterium]|nr:YchJ family protein [Elusimicrobiota bacterium]